MEASFKPRTHRVEGTTVEFSKRINPEVDITIPNYLLCVNFNTIRNAVYAYSGAPERRGIRRVGYTHLISANHNIKCYTPDPTKHIIFTFTPSRLRYLALTTFEEDRFALRTEGIPFFDPFVYQIACSVRDELCAELPGDSIMIESLTTMLAVRLLRQYSNLKPSRSNASRWHRTSCF